MIQDIMYLIYLCSPNKKKMKAQIENTKKEIELLRQACQKCHPSMKAYYQGKYAGWKKHLEYLLNKN